MQSADFDAMQENVSTSRKLIYISISYSIKYSW